MSPGKVDLAEKLSLFDERWSPNIVGEMNGKHVKLLGEFVCHHHDAEDEFFLVVKGRFRMDFRDREKRIEVGQFVALPRGVGHRPPAEEEAHVMLFEPASTVKGCAGGGMTMAELDKI